MENSLLIIDDDNLNLTQLSKILKPEYTVRAASGGAAGIKAAEKFMPDLILLDILMPEMDGYRVFEAIKNSEVTTHIPVIFITGLNDKNDEIKGLQLGAVDYISKPFDDIIVKLRVHQQIRNINQMRIIENLSMLDQLTGIPNRRNFDGRMNIEWSRAIREKMSIGFMMIDIDRFKTYNDTYGHPQGDKALIAVAHCISGVLKRSSDFAARWGGEEFSVLLPNADSAGGMMMAEKIREAVEAMEITCADGTITKVTISIGVNTHIPSPDFTIEEFVSRADRALYESKHAGRNKVSHFIYE